MEVACLMEGACSCYIGGQFKWRENGHVIEVLTLMEGEWSRYRGGQFKGGRIFMLYTLMGVRMVNVHRGGV